MKRYKLIKKVIQNKNKIGCGYHPEGTTRVYLKEEIYPNGICPWLYYAAYPYMLGILYGADFEYNRLGDAWAMCPAKNGCRFVVRKRKHPGFITDSRITKENYYVIFVEIVSLGSCPAGHNVGHKFVFPTCLKQHYLCPAAWFHAFPFLNEKPPKCLKKEAIRCPDWKSDVTIKI